MRAYLSYLMRLRGLRGVGRGDFRMNVDALGVGLLIDRRILEYLECRGKSITTYRLSQCLGLSWSTVFSHCMRLRSDGRVVCDTVDGLSGKRHFWSLPGA